jgi:hypothetical protein
MIAAVGAGEATGTCDDSMGAACLEQADPAARQEMTAKSAPFKAAAPD